MLERCEQLAAGLQPYRGLLAGLALASAAALPAAIFLVSGEQGQMLSLLAITFLLWALTLGAFVRAFSTPLPPPDANARLLGRLRAAVRRAYRRALVVLIAALLVLVIWFSVRTIQLVLDTP